MTDLRSSLRRLAADDADLDLTAVRTRAGRLRAQRRAARGAAAIACAATVLGVGVPVLLAEDDRRPDSLTPAVSTTPSLAPSPEPSADLGAVVQVFYTSDPQCTEVEGVPRQVESTDAVAATLRQLLAGPTADERARGLSSFFGPETADLLRSVRIEDGTAFVDFGDFISLNGVSTSCGSTSFLAQLDATVGQFPSVDRAYYSVEGDFRRFYASLERECPSELECPEDQPASWPPQVPGRQGGTDTAVYLAVVQDPADPRLTEGRARAQEAGYEPGSGGLGCDQGAREALGMPEGEYTHVALYFADRATADRFLGLWPHEVVGVAEVQTFCLD